MSKDNSRFLSVREVAEWFGVNQMTIYRKVKKGEIPAIRFGKKWLFPKDVLEGWIESRVAVSGEEKGTMNLKTAAVDLSKIPGLQLVYVFGSAVTGFTTPLSDIDIAYLDDGSLSPFDFEPGLENIILNRLSNNSKVDLVRLNDAPLAMQYKVISEGKLIYKKSDEVRALFEERVINLYLDYSFALEKFYRDTYHKEAA